MRKLLISLLALLIALLTVSPASSAPPLPELEIDYVRTQDTDTPGLAHITAIVSLVNKSTNKNLLGAVLTVRSEIGAVIAINSDGNYLGDPFWNIGDVLVSGGGVAEVEFLAHGPAGESVEFSIDVFSAGDGPVATVANKKLTVLAGEVAVLDGTDSYHPAGYELTYTWSLLEEPEGANTRIGDADSPRGWFVPAMAGTYRFALVVKDPFGIESSDVITATVDAHNPAPYADAGPDQENTVGQMVKFDGRESFDRLGDTIYYTWTFVHVPRTSAVNDGHLDVTSVNGMAIFTPDVPGNYIIHLKARDRADVNDPVMKETVDTANARIRGSANSSPVADAGDNEDVFTQKLVTLDGSGSKDIDGDPLIYTWTVICTPDDVSIPFLHGSDTVSPTFTPSIPGVYEFKLAVSDGVLESVPDTVHVNVFSGVISEPGPPVVLPSDPPAPAPEGKLIVHSPVPNGVYPVDSPERLNWEFIGPKPSSATIELNLAGKILSFQVTGNGYTPSKAIWTEIAALGVSVTFQLKYEANEEFFTSALIPFSVAQEGAVGEIIFWRLDNGQLGNSEGNIYTMPADGSTLPEPIFGSITGDGCAGCHVITNSSFMAVNSYGLEIVDIADRANVFPFDTATDGWSSVLSWDPSGTKLLYSKFAGGTFDLSVYDMDSGLSFAVPFLSSPTRDEVMGVWAPDGSIVCVCTPAGLGSNFLLDTTSDSYIVRNWPETGDEQLLVAGDPSAVLYYPVVDPTGRWLAYNTSEDTSYSSKTAKIVLLELTDPLTGLPPVAPTPSIPDELNGDTGGNSWPTWSPNGSWIAFSSNRDGDGTDWSLYRSFVYDDGSTSVATPIAGASLPVMGEHLPYWLDETDGDTVLPFPWLVDYINSANPLSETDDFSPIPEQPVPEPLPPPPVKTVWYDDADHDGYGNLETSVIEELQPEGYVPSAGLFDCDDGDSSSFPLAFDIPGDGIDQNCDGSDSLSADPPTWYEDADSDGYGTLDTSITAEQQPLGYVPETGFFDCNDDDSSIYPFALDIPDDGIDQDCDGLDPSERTTPPARPETPFTWYEDADHDGYGNQNSTTTAATPPEGYLPDVGFFDCDDRDSSIYPFAVEIPNDGIDQDCSGADGTAPPPATPYTWHEDADHDGYGNQNSTTTAATPPEGYLPDSGLFDCDDSDSSIYPFAVEIPDDGVDQDCTGFDATEIPPSTTFTWYQDADGDGYVNPGVSMVDQAQPQGYIRENHGPDCNDDDHSIHPGALDLLGDGIDQNCDGQDGLGECTANRQYYYEDMDGDGFSTGATYMSADSCDTPPIGHVPQDELISLVDTDCDDTDASINPNATEIPGDGIDQNCDRSDIVNTWHRDADGDGYGDQGATTDAARQPAGFVADDTDCNDGSRLIYPGATENPNDGIDQDCDGSDLIVAPGCEQVQTTYYEDADNDGYASGATYVLIDSCDTPPGGYTLQDGLVNLVKTDCNDADASVHPGASEILDDGVDQDCDGMDNTLTWYEDADADGYGNPTSSTTAPTQPVGYVSDYTDCNDDSSDINPGATEIPDDGIDQDCSGSDIISPPLCLPVATTYYGDLDSDGYTSGATYVVSDSCDTAPSGYVVQDWLIDHVRTDCNDTDFAINPGASEILGDDIDQDCDGVDNNRTWHEDADGDGYGNPAATTLAITQPVGYVLNYADCDDGSSSIHPGVLDIPNDGVDQDCDGGDFIAPPVCLPVSTTYYEDADGDRYSSGNTYEAADSCDTPTSGFVPQDRLLNIDGTDCNDTDASIYPGQNEILDDGIDQNCDEVDNVAPRGWYRDLDGDGYGNPQYVITQPYRPSGYVDNAGDCLDVDPNYHPGAEEIPNDGLDQNCDGSDYILPDGCQIESATYYEDQDGDGYTTGVTYESVDTCDMPPTGYSTQDALLDLVNMDCNDGDFAANSGAAEVKDDGIDQNCDGFDAITLHVWYRDVDDDNFGNSISSTTAATQPIGYVSDSTDCDDSRNSVYPGAPEILNDGIDQDCDGGEPAAFIIDPYSGIQLIYAGPGTFQMGDVNGAPAEHPERTTTFTESFYIGKYEITQDQWQLVMGDNPSNYDSDPQHGDYPVEQVSWDDVQGFIWLLNDLNGNPGCQRDESNCYFLPSEAQWEYAAKGGQQSLGFKYAGSDHISYVAWYNDNSQSTSHHVGRKFANELGIMDMSGNVAEWVEDCFIEDYYSTSTDIDPPPATADQCDRRVTRGGSWNTGDLSGQSPLRVAGRSYSDPASTSMMVGFRVAYRK